MEPTERLSGYIDSLSSGNGAFLDELEQQARAQGVPLIRGEMQSFLKVLLAIRKPRKILEVGTGVGFSALLMADCTDSACQITTIENCPERVRKAQDNIALAGMEGRITLLNGDAQDLLPTLQGPFDFVFMDAAKGQYLSFLGDVLRLLGKDGVLLSDNVLQGGDILESHYAVEHRNRTIYKRMREYLYTLTHTKGLLTSVIPVGDGAALTVKQEETEE